MMYPKNYHKPTGKILRFICDFLIPYSFGYRMGYLDGAKKMRYIDGVVDESERMHKFYAEHIKKYYKLK